MTNEEAKVFLDNLIICVNEHPVVADWLIEIANRKTEPQIFTWGKEVHEYCKRNCCESKARMRDGDRFIVCGRANDEICISLWKCPLGKWVAGEGFHIFPMDEPQTDCTWKKGEE